MKIFVLIKEVPDTFGERKLNQETGLAERADSDCVLDEITERGLDLARRYSEENTGTEVVALSMAPSGATASIRRSLAMGADSAIHVVDDDLIGADLGLTAKVLAAVIRRSEPDLVIAGNLSTDGAGGVVPAMIAEHLNYAQLTALASVEINVGSVQGVRRSEHGDQQVKASIPAVVSITEALPEAGFPSFKTIMAAKKKPLEVLSLADLGIDANPVLEPRCIMTEVGQKPPRAAGIKIHNEGDAGVKLAEYLVQNRLV